MMFLGVLLVILGVSFFFLKSILVKRNAIFSKLGAKFSFGCIGIGVMFFLLPYLFFWAEPGYQYFVVYPSGSKTAVMDEGIKWRGFAKIIPWQKYIDVKVVTKGDKKGDIEGVMQLIPVRFIDQVTAEVKVSTRFQLPKDKESFVKMAIEFRSLPNLVNNTLIPTVREVVSNTGYMFAAQDYISGSASDFRVAIEDQLKFGAYSVEKLEFRDTISGAIENNSRKILEIQTRYEVIKRKDKNGKIIRIAHDINEKNIIVAQVIVDDVILERVFKKRLEAQRDESAKRQLEQQKIKTAKDAQARIIAEGERDKAAERVTQEKEQVKALISIETKLKQEDTNKKLAKISLETERLRAQAKKVAADAESYQNAKLVSAGLTPQERANIEKEIAIGVAREISKIKFPDVMIIGENGKGGKTPIESLIGASMAKQLLNNKLKR